MNELIEGATTPFNSDPLLSKPAVEPSPRIDYPLDSNASWLPVQLAVDELAQAAPPDRVSEDRFPFDPEPPQSQLTVEEGAAPEYLNPDPNPLLFPTQPEEVDIIGSQSHYPRSSY